MLGNEDFYLTSSSDDTVWGYCFLLVSDILVTSTLYRNRTRIEKLKAPNRINVVSFQCVSRSGWQRSIFISLWCQTDDMKCSQPSESKEQMYHFAVFAMKILCRHASTISYEILCESRFKRLKIKPCEQLLNMKTTFLNFGHTKKKC